MIDHEMRKMLLQFNIPSVWNNVTGLNVFMCVCLPSLSPPLSPSHSLSLFLMIHYATMFTTFSTNVKSSLKKGSKGHTPDLNNGF